MSAAAGSRCLPVYCVDAGICLLCVSVLCCGRAVWAVVWVLLQPRVMCSVLDALALWEKERVFPDPSVKKQCVVSGISKRPTRVW